MAEGGSQLVIPLKRGYIKLCGGIDQDDYEKVKALEKWCVEQDGISLKLELEYKLAMSSNDRDAGAITEFMFYDHQALIGYIGINQFDGGPLEVNGMVHPDYRRMGVFNRLYSLVQDEWKRRGSQDMLLLCDHESLSGLEFMKHTGAHYDNSEYEMFLLGEPGELPTLKSLNLREALNQDAKEIAEQNELYFQVNATELKRPEEEAKRGMYSYLAEMNHVTIGKVHLEVQDGVGGIYGLGVLPEHRRKGYGREIVMRAVEKLQEKHAEKMMLQVAVKNKQALELYRSCGFEVTSTMDYFKLTNQ